MLILSLSIQNSKEEITRSNVLQKTKTQVTRTAQQLCANLRATPVTPSPESQQATFPASARWALGTISAVLADLCPLPTRFHRQPPPPPLPAPTLRQPDSPQTLPNVLQGQSHRLGTTLWAKTCLSAGNTPPASLLLACGCLAPPPHTRPAALRLCATPAPSGGFTPPEARAPPQTLT